MHQGQIVAIITKENKWDILLRKSFSRCFLRVIKTFFKSKWAPLVDWGINNRRLQNIYKKKSLKLQSVKTNSFRNMIFKTKLLPSAGLQLNVRFLWCGWLKIRNRLRMWPDLSGSGQHWIKSYNSNVFLERSVLLVRRRMCVCFTFSPQSKFLIAWMSPGRGKLDVSVLITTGEY